MLTHTEETKMIIKTSTLVRLIIGTGLLCLATADSGAADTPDSMNPMAPVRNWKKQEPLPTSWGLYDVDMVSATEGWAVSHPITGDHAYILHTINGGKTWQRQGGLFSQLSGISFADALMGWPWVTSIDLRSMAAEPGSPATRSEAAITMSIWWIKTPAMPAVSAR